MPSLAFSAPAALRVPSGSHRASSLRRGASTPVSPVSPRRRCSPVATRALPPAFGSDSRSPSQSPVPASTAAARLRRLARVGLALAPLGVAAVTLSGPALAAGAGATAAGGVGIGAALRGMDPAGFVSGVVASFSLVLASEIGDKTFFISALLSMKYKRLLVLLGSMIALGGMTVISVGIGQVFHALPASLNTSVPFDDYAAAALLLWFGFQNLRDALMNGEDEEELEGARETVDGAKSGEKHGALRVVSETCSLVFLAEWGDKSMLATVALAAAKNPLGVVVGGITGHLIASIIAVVGGSLLGKYISERTAKIVAGILFWVFAVLTIFRLF